jgi:copper resistance protein C
VISVIRRASYLILILAFVASCSLSLWAHAILMDSTPKLHSTVKGPDVAIILRYNVRIDGGRSRVELLTPDGSETTLSLSKQNTPDILQCNAKGLKPGAYKLKWSVLASDGHMSSGDLPFTVD